MAHDGNTPWFVCRYVKSLMYKPHLIFPQPVAMQNPYEREQVQCLLCKYQVPIDYKNVRLLSQFVSPYTGRVYGRNITRLCKKQQDVVENAIRKSQDAGEFIGLPSDWVRLLFFTYTYGRCSWKKHSAVLLFTLKPVLLCIMQYSIRLKLIA